MMRRTSIRPRGHAQHTMWERMCQTTVLWTANRGEGAPEERRTRSHRAIAGGVCLETVLDNQSLRRQLHMRTFHKVGAER
jgi:hypothetical protein